MRQQYIVTILSILLLLTTSCTSAGPQIDLDSRFSPDQRLAWQRAADQWNLIVDQPVAIRRGGKWHALLEPTTPLGFLGMTNAHDHKIQIEPTTPPERFYGVVLHEMGHAIGLSHHDGPGVMNQNITTTNFTVYDFIDCDQHGKC